jgi:uncharacterized protein with GYD domain
MPTYISLLKWTDQGMRAIKDSPQRVDAAKRAFSAAGGRMTDFYLVLGDFDVVNVGEFPNDEAYLTTLLEVASRGAVRTTTLKAFTEDEYRRVIAAIPP